MATTIGKIGFMIALGLILCVGLVASTFGQSVLHENHGQTSKAAQVVVGTKAPQGGLQVVQTSGVQLDSYQQPSQFEGYGPQRSVRFTRIIESYQFRSHGSYGSYGSYGCHRSHRRGHGDDDD